VAPHELSLAGAVAEPTQEVRHGRFYTKLNTPRSRSPHVREKRWAKTDPGLRSHPNFLDLVAELDSSPIIVDGLLHGLWAMAFTDAPDGNITRFKARALARAVGWDVRWTSPEVLVTSLVDTGFLDRVGDELHIHDWEEWGGALYAERTKDARRKAEVRESAPAEPTVPRTSTDIHGHPPDPRAKTKTKRETETKKGQEQGQELPFVDGLAPADGRADWAKDFDLWWTTYHKVGSRADAWEVYQHWRKQGATAADLLTAAENYIAHCTATDCKVKHGATFLAKKPNRWREWVLNEEHGDMDRPGGQKRSTRQLDTSFGVLRAVMSKEEPP
jgi:hypothetical protein